MTWSSGQMWTPEHEEPDEVEKVEPSPYTVEQWAILERLRDESGDVPYPADG